MSFRTEFKAARKLGKSDRISKEINKLSLKRRALKLEALKLTHERETLLGQELTETPRSLLPRRAPRPPNPPDEKLLQEILLNREAAADILV